MAMGSPASPRNVGAVQPPAPLAFYILDVPSSLGPPRPLPPGPASLLSSSCRSFATLAAASSLLGITLFAFPAAGRATRRVASCATFTRTYSSHPVRAYIDRTHSPLARASSVPVMHAALHLPAAACSSALPLSRCSLVTGESVGLQRVFSINRGEPHSLL